jgi:N-acetylglucosaminyl-diphospho-decaprenol L-rhamnosyltransferase
MPTYSPSVTVAIVSYKSAALTVHCLKSISAERQAARFPIDVVVVDNASGDYDEVATAIKANGWSPWVKLILAPRNGGFGYGNNIAIWHANQDAAPAYLYMLNPDTEVRIGAISTLVEFLEEHPGVGIVGSGFENLDGSDWPIAFKFPSMCSEICHCLDIGIVSRLFRRWLVPQVMPKVSMPIDWVSGASMMVRSSVLRALGGFDENYFLYFEETDFSRRAKHAGFPTWYVPTSKVMHISGYSTHVTSHTGARRRFPDYWFESRRRYFVLTFGLWLAMWIDTLALVASSVGWLKRTLMKQQDRMTPFFIRDLWRHSLLRPKNHLVRAPNTAFHS